MSSERFTQQQVLEELERVIDSEEFSKTRRLRDFLSFTVKETLAGNHRNLSGYVVGIEVFDRKPDFDPQSDTLVRVTAGKLRRKLSQYYDNEGVDNPLRLQMPLGGYRIQASTPDAASRGRAGHPPVLAIQAISCIAEDGDHQVFCQSLLTELCLALSGQDTYRLISPNLPEICEEANSNSPRTDYHLLTSLRWYGPHLDVTVQFVDARNGQIQWIENRRFVYEEAQLFELQRDIARFAASRVIDPELPDSVQKTTPQTEASLVTG